MRMTVTLLAATVERPTLGTSVLRRRALLLPPSISVPATVALCVAPSLHFTLAFHWVLISVPYVAGACTSQFTCYLPATGITLGHAARYASTIPTCYIWAYLW